MSSFYYFLWLCYGTAAGGLIYLWWRLVGNLRVRFLRDLLLGSLVILLLFPWFAAPEQSALAPALIIILHEALFSEENGLSRGAIPILLTYLLFILLLALCYWIVGRYRLNSNKTQPKDPYKEPVEKTVNDKSTVAPNSATADEHDTADKSATDNNRATVDKKIIPEQP